ncbi:kinase-like domain-containing protein [Triangularia verruculosa]|uniref:Kinase-like domain-containing protein n=1 Tax=Triangularia verruculosa TaxID=2587418 RepID=A0AAN7ATB8_9PEZI|nr:kinase-like domain-containing protein [Triangularia verruculosa]
MFANALKSIGASSNINSKYQISSTLTATAGPWKIYSAKQKATGKEYSVFVFDKKTLDTGNNGLGGRQSATAHKKVVEEVVERLKKEASSLARLRHPGVLELVEPVEETRGGGLQFVAEPVTASLSGLLQEKDDQERGGGFGGRSSRYITEDANGTRRRRELEIDELEIQKGLLQVSKALEFLHDNAGLVHGNLTPDAILINAKSDWKLSGLSFCSPPEPSTIPTSIQPIILGEVLNPDPRLPKTVQLNLDYTSPDFVLDNNLTTFADMFSLGLLCIALYNSPHRSPIECNTSISAYKRVFQSSQSVPTATNNYLSSRPLPKELAQHVLPRLLTRRPAQRMTAKEFQESEYFNNVLISTIRFLEGFPAKTPNEKQQFLRGLIKVLPNFPKSVMEKKLLPALLEELKDKELISLILHNVFKIIGLLPAGRRAFNDKVRPKLKEIFVTNAKQPQEKDANRDAGLMIVIEQLSIIASNCNGKEFKDDILPIFYTALESPTPSLINAALTSLPVVLPVLDFSTIKGELFPVIATIFSKTNSLAIKVRGLEAFVTLCGGSNDPHSDDGLDGLATEQKKATSSTALDKFTMQEKIVPLIKAIKTREPAVMTAALNVLKVVGRVADGDFVALELLPLLWSMSLNPQLNLREFQAFMDLVKTLSTRVEDEQTKKLQELAGGAVTSPGLKDDFMSFGAISGSSLEANGTSETDFEALVKGRTTTTTNALDSGWETRPSVASASSSVRKSTPTATFSWSTPPVASPTTTSHLKAQTGGFRTVTPDLAAIQPMAPTTTQFSQPLQPQSNPISPQSASVNWSSAGSATTPSNIWASTSQPTSNPWGAPSATSQPAASPWASTTQPNSNIWASQPLTSAFSSLSLNQQQQRPQPSSSSSFALPPPPGAPGASSANTGLSLPKPPGSSTSGLGGMNNMSSLASLGANKTGMGMGAGMGAGMNNTAGNMSMNSMMGNLGGMAQQQKPPQQQPKGGLDKYESLL